MTEKKGDDGLSDDSRRFEQGLQRELQKANLPKRIDDVEELRKRSQGIANAVNSRNRSYAPKR
jgi:hypothetical protein